MTPKQYEDAIEKLGLSQRASSKLVGVGERQVRKWIADEAKIPKSVARLLRLMIKHGIKPEDVK
jgi:DNA-binding transcriptional regulator YiaG